MTRTVSHAASCLLVACLAGCGPVDLPATQLVVTVDADPSVRALLKRVRAAVHPTDAREGEAAQAHEFLLAGAGAAAQAGSIEAPFSFAVVQGAGGRTKLVVEGYDTLAADAAPVIEQKRIAEFAPDRALHVHVQLADRCYAMINPCTSLDRTCRPEARACEPVPEAQTTPATPSVDAPPADAAVALGCPEPSPCPRDYPCTPTPPAGYVCLGQRAEWPVPIGGSRSEPRYDVRDPRVTVDEITGLVWQRERPVRYEGCSGAQSAAGDLCTADEAKLYCSRLALADRRWRLPSKPELESLLDHRLDAPTFDRQAFQSTFGQFTYWTSSLLPRAPGAAHAIAPGWTAHFRDATLRLSTPAQLAAVRCVSGTPHGRVTPDQHFVVDPASDTVIDRATALVWQRTAAAPSATFDEATRHCAALGAGWRLPHVKELLTLLDPTRVDPALDAAFPAPSSGLAWASVTKAGSVESWIVDERVGASYPHRLATTLRDPRHAAAPTPHARCVRNEGSLP